MTPEALRQQLSNPELLRGLTQFVRSKVRDRDARDLAQLTLMEALAAKDLPEEGAFKGWLYGIARHKIADHYRRQREAVSLEHDQVEAPSERGGESVRDLLHWVERELPAGNDAQKTLEWMLREADGDPLEAIAEEQRLPAPTVRQRVSRMRRHLRQRWSLQLAAAVLGLCVVVTGYVWYQANSHVPIAPEVVTVPTPQEQAETLRRLALEHCGQGLYEECLSELERALRLDGKGDSLPEVQAARRQIEVARAAAASSATPSPAPTASALPSSTPVSTANRPSPSKTSVKGSLDE